VVSGDIAKLAADMAMKRADDAMKRANSAAESAAYAQGQLESLAARVGELEAVCGAGARRKAGRAKGQGKPGSQKTTRRRAVRLDP